MVGSDSSPAVSSLLCGEDGACLDSTDITTGSDIFSIKETEMGIFIEEEDEEDEGDGVAAVLYDGDYDLYIETLVSKETSFVQRFRGDSSPEFEDWFKCARNEAIRWILKVGSSNLYLSPLYIFKSVDFQFSICRQE